MDKLPNRIRALRKSRQWTLEYVALSLGSTIGQVSMLETGKRPLSQEWMQRIAYLFDVSVADILPPDQNPDRLSDEERQLISRFRAGSNEQRAALKGVSEALIPYSPQPDFNDSRNLDVA